MSLASELRCCLCRLQPLAAYAICLMAWLLLSSITLQQLLRHPGSCRRILCFGVSSSMAALSTSQLLLLIWCPWVALYDRARSALRCAAIRVAQERGSGLCLTPHKMSLQCLLCSLHLHSLVDPVVSELVQGACRSFSYVVSLLASTLMTGLGSISKDLSWFTSGRVYAVHGWLLVGLQSS